MTFSGAVSSAVRAGVGPVRYPLSTQQQLWCDSEQAGAFGPRFILASTLRITGPVDVGALQGALDDVVARHELLRAVVVRDGEPPYQEVHPPSPVRLEVRDLLVAAGRSREEVAEEHLTEAATSSVPVEELPLLRAVLARFDDRDWLLSLLSHHTACDAWSLHLVLRDLAAFYAARTGVRPLKLPETVPYHEYTRWQFDNSVGEAARENLEYWRTRLRDAELFTLPPDRPVPSVHTEPYQLSSFTLEPAVVRRITQLARTLRCSNFMVVLATFNVMAHKIRGTLVPVINTMIHGRGQPRFAETVGPFLNFLAMRTDLAGCGGFREIVLRTRTTCLEAYAHEMPINEVERERPSAWAAARDPANCNTIFGYFESPFAAADGSREAFRFSEGTRTVRRRSRQSEQMPGGAAWNLALDPGGELSGYVQFNPGEFDVETVERWVRDYCRLVAAAVADPDRDWRTL